MKSAKLTIFLIIICAVFFGFYQLEARYYFDWDQERDAQIIWQIVREHKPTLIGPIAVGPGSFFLGPLWFYLLTPFYVLFNMDPIAGAIFASMVNVVTAIVIFIITKKIFGIKEAIVAGFLWATSFDRSSFNPILVPLFTIIFIYLLIQISRSKSKYVPWAFLIFGLGLQIHVQILFFLIPLIFTVYKASVKEIIKGVALFLLTFTPIIIFDLRHGFGNSKAFINFFLGQSGPSITFLQSLSASFIKFFTAAAGLLPILPIDAVKKGAFLVFCAILGIKFSKTSIKIKIILLSFIILPPVLFSIYKGNLSEYYYAIVFVPVIIGFGSLFRKIPAAILLLFIIIILYLRFSVFIDKTYTLSLKYKREAVSYIIKDSGSKDFILHIDSSYGYATGFNYLFTYYKNVPKEKGDHLYLISIPWSQKEVTAKKMVSDDYKFKNAELNIFGDIGVFKMY
jgi:hypothetical protein